MAYSCLTPAAHNSEYMKPWINLLTSSLQDFFEGRKGCGMKVNLIESEKKNTKDKRSLQNPDCKNVSKENISLPTLSISWKLNFFNARWGFCCCFGVLRSHSSVVDDLKITLSKP